jgi:hypothetical protein
MNITKWLGWAGSRIYVFFANKGGALGEIYEKHYFVSKGQTLTQYFIKLESN